ncbi:hypothetical protein T01_7531 [Trichinella spiralis]|uniref:Transmembrane protein n=1 Tax=Trichinella spiralis TaxID=6334 RepID=A0A0V1BZ21_TRISP|nr:hypothetical protein T01_7531 [Trichinella spiralis]
MEWHSKSEVYGSRPTKLANQCASSTNTTTTTIHNRDTHIHTLVMVVGWLVAVRVFWLFVVVTAEAISKVGKAQSFHCM